MPKFEEFYKKMYEKVDRSAKIYATAVDAPSNKGKVIKPELEGEYQNCLFVRESGIKSFIANMLKEGGREKFVENFYKLLGNNEETTVNLLIEGTESFLTQRSIKNAKVFGSDKEHKTKEETIGAIFTYFDNLKEKGNDLWKGLFVYLTNKVYLDYGRCTEVSQLEKFIGVVKAGFGDNVDKYVPDPEEYASWEEKGELADNHPSAERIAELKKENADDKEYVSILDDANKIIISGDSRSTAYMSNYAENLGRDFDDVKIKTVYNALTEKNPEVKDVFDEGSRLLQLKSDCSVYELSNLVKDSVNTPCKVSEEQKQAIKNVIKKITDAGIFNKENFETESQHKIYGLSLLVNTASDLKKAVDEGNREKIVELTNKYREVEKKYDDILKDISKLDESYSMVSNISSSRESSVPFKYRNDPLGVSRFNGLWMFIGMCESAGISVNDMIDDPVRNMHKITVNVAENTKLNKYLKNNDLSKIISELSNPQGDIFNVCLEDQKVFDSFPRGMDGFMMVCGNNDAKWELVKNNMVFQGGFSADIAGKYGMLGFYLMGDDRIEKLQRMMLVEKSDLDLLKIDPDNGYSLDINTLEKYKKFNKTEYLETKTTPSAVILRSLKVMKDFETVYKGNMFAGDVKTAVNNNMEFLKNFELSETASKAIEAIKSGDLDKITEEDMKKLQSESVISKEKQNGLNKISQANKKKYDEFVSDMFSLIDVAHKPIKEGYDRTVEEEQSYAKSKYQSEKGVFAYISNIVEQNGKENIIETAADIFSTAEIKKKLDLGLEDASSFLSKIGVKGVKLPEDYKNKPFEEKIQIFKSAVSSLSEKERNFVWEKYSEKTVAEIKSSMGKVDSKKGFENILNNIEKTVSKSGIDLYKFIPEKSEYASVEELGEKNDEPSYEQQISDCLNGIENLSAELKNALDDANKILVKGKSSSVRYMGGLAEDMGNASMFNMTAKVIESLKNDKETGIDIDNDFANVKSNLNFKDDIPVERRENIIKKYGESHTEIKTENKQKLLKIIKKMEDNGLFDPSTYKSESGSKIYGLRKLYNCRQNLISAIEQKNPEKIIEAQKEYRATEKVYDEILKDIKDLDGSDTFISNISSSRESYFPAKYRNDPVGVSRLSGLWQYMGLCHTCGVSPEEVINNPIKGVDKLIENTLDNSHTKNYMKEHDLSDIVFDLANGVNGEYFKVGNKDLQSVLNFSRGVDGMLYVSGDTEDKVNIIKESSVYNSAFIGSVLNQVSSCAMYYLKNGTEKDRIDATEKISRMILVEKEDLDFLKITPGAENYIDYKTRTRRQPFDKEGYVKEKTMPTAVVSRMLKVLNDFSAPDKKYKDSAYKNIIINAVKQTAKTLDGVAKSETVAKICDVIKSKNPLNIKKTDLLNFNAEAKFCKTEKDGIKAENVGDVIKDIADLKKKYDDRSIFAKIFYSSVRRQSRIIDGMITKLTEKGISRENVNNALIGYSENNQDKVNTAIESVKAELNPVPEVGANIDDNKSMIEVVEAKEEETILSEPVVGESEKQAEVAIGEKR